MTIPNMGMKWHDWILLTVLVVALGSCIVAQILGLKWSPLATTIWIVAYRFLVRDG